MTAHHITINHGRGRMFVAIIEGRDPQYGFKRKFLKMMKTGNRMNCYEDYTSLDAVPAGAVLDVCHANYKGKETRYFCRIDQKGAQIKIDAKDVAQMIA